MATSRSDTPGAPWFTHVLRGVAVAIAIAAVIDYHVGTAFEDFFDVRVVFFRRCAVLCKYIKAALYECRGNVVLS